jgi:hypothetical protein
MPSSQRGGATSGVYQMDLGDDGPGGCAPLDECITKAVLSAMQAQQSQQAPGDRAAGFGTASQTHRGYPSHRSGRGGGRGRGAGNAGGRSLPDVPGVSVDVVRQRWDARQCLRCGSEEHRSVSCPNAILPYPKN